MLHLGPSVARLEVKNISVKRKNELVLEKVSFHVSMPGMMALTGPNGGGKTTLFEVLLGWIKPCAGEIIWPKGQGRVLSYLSQQVERPRMAPLTVNDYILMARWAPSPSSEAFRLEELVEILELKNLRDVLISELSGGEWKRVCLARTLYSCADLYLLDEPFNHLDVLMEDRIGHALEDAVKNKQKTFLVISHDWHAIDHHFTEALLLNKRILIEGSVREVSDRYLNWRDPKHHEWIHTL